MTKKLWPVLLALSLLLPGYASAGEKERLAAAYKLTKVSGIAEVMETVMRGFVDQAMKTVIKTGSSNERIAARMFNNFLDEELEATRDDLRWEIAKLYSRQFTESELFAVLNFMDSPVGRSWLRKQPILEAEGAELGEAWGLFLVNRIKRRMKEATR